MMGKMLDGGYDGGYDGGFDGGYDGGFGTTLCYYRKTVSLKFVMLKYLNICVRADMQTAGVSMGDLIE